MGIMQEMFGTAFICHCCCKAFVTLCGDLWIHQGGLDADDIAHVLKTELDCRPGAMAKYLKLREPKYLKTAAYSHFGREPYVENGLSYFEWERVKDLSKYLGMSRDEILVAMRESDHLSRWVA